MKTRSEKQKGMTLVEIMYAAAIGVTLMGMSVGFLVETGKGNYIIDQRLAQAIELRRLTQDLIYTASRANQMYLYRSVAPADRAAPSNELVVDVSSSPVNHPAGDFVVFVFYEFPKPSTETYHRIQSLVGYYLDASAGAVGPIKKITIDLSKNVGTGAATPTDLVADYDDSTSKTMVETVMTNNWANATHARVQTYALNARGVFLSETVNEGAGRLFYYRDSQLSLMVSGQSYGTGFTANSNTYTYTFSFSVTPRS